MASKKTFDCVEMKQKGQDAIRKRLEGLSPEQQLAYWAERARVMHADIAARAAHTTPQPRKKSA